jgi:hypothetical protein
VFTVDVKRSTKLIENQNKRTYWTLNLRFKPLHLLSFRLKLVNHLCSPIYRKKKQVDKIDNTIAPLLLSLLAEHEVVSVTFVVVLSYTV